jgi:hypothetical protein
MSLEDELRNAIDRGFLHLSLDRHFKTGKWNCGYRNTDNANVVYVEDDDPIEAIRKALRGYRGPKKLKAEVSGAAQQPRKRRRANELI